MRFAIAAASLLAACATGTTLVTGQARAPTSPAAVAVYLQDPAQPYEVIGAVASTSVLGVNAQANLDRAMADVKARAASMGPLASSSTTWARRAAPRLSWAQSQDRP